VRESGGKGRKKIRFDTPFEGGRTPLYRTLTGKKIKKQDDIV
jgi:ribosomal protein L15